MTHNGSVYASGFQVQHASGAVAVEYSSPVCVCFRVAMACAARLLVLSPDGVLGYRFDCVWLLP